VFNVFPDSVESFTVREEVRRNPHGGGLPQATKNAFAAAERAQLEKLPEADRFLSGLTGYLKDIADKDLSFGARNNFGPTFSVMVANVIADVQDIATLLQADPSLMSEWRSCSDHREQARLITRLEREGKLNVRQTTELWMGWTGHRVKGYLANLNGQQLNGA
jgi:hypothetical protein